LVDILYSKIVLLVYMMNEDFYIDLDLWTKIFNLIVVYTLTDFSNSLRNFSKRTLLYKNKCKATGTISQRNIFVTT
jgi:hypothetical protein